MGGLIGVPAATERLAQIMWLLAHLDDVRSDMSVYHRIDVDDVESMPASKFFMLAERLPAYGGVLAVSVRHAVAEQSPAPSPTRSAKALIGPEQIPQLLGQQLYGEVPGLAAVLSCSTAPLAPYDEEGVRG